VIPRRIPLLAALCVASLTAMAKETIPSNEIEANVPPYTLPDVLAFSNGHPVRTPAEWGRRRAELLDLVAAHEYGAIPSGLTRRAATVVSVKSDALGGKAIRKHLRVPLADGPDPVTLDLLVYLPKNARGPVPAFLGLNFAGNHAAATEADVPLSRGWLPDSAKGSVNHAATDAARGTESEAWPIERILERGYALATAHYADIEADYDGGWKKGLRGAVAPDGPGHVFAPGEWGAISAWSWGLTRGFDALADDPAIDASRVAVIGHSRLGKTALWTGARDPRFALVVANQSGEGGAALARRWFGETVWRINSSFPHWFCGRFKDYNQAVERLPFDQHSVVSLVAPRPIYIGSAEEDRWADPKGEYLSGWHASRVYQLLGRTGLPGETQPPVNTSVGDAVGYHVRTGKHALTGIDWEHYLRFADRHLAR
jgi:hypothetical protein